ncbi:S-adenosyl-L-methionine-dependent methyltransferase [Tribonema minus]|uniref:S-adenosyl-L-methionine-dependent methyltransferase n=1 Tax=Tribonema minus TaxID=303371 RepID=A0A835ZP38_9STRA|nr:S-adenosyl-L-methionine-dependent methyltransferase [Tribonema minus]
MDKGAIEGVGVKDDITRVEQAVNNRATKEDVVGVKTRQDKLTLAAAALCLSGKVSYWDDRYTKDPEPFDWYQRYSGIKDLVAAQMKHEDNVLMLGCGNSRLSEDMLEDGFTSITNIDISRVVIDQMIERHKDKPALVWQRMNAMALEYPDESFDAAVDKGTLDSLMCGEGASANVAKMCMEVSRVLKPNGVYLVISYGAPDSRLKYLQSDDYSWTVSVATLPKPAISAAAIPDTKDASAVHYVYLCRKGGTAEEGG